MRLTPTLASNHAATGSRLQSVPRFELVKQTASPYPFDLTSTYAEIHQKWKLN